MAECIPDRLPRQASQGESRLFHILSKLPEDCLVYYEPIVENRYPDFIVLVPSLGLMVIEVKGWRINEILSGDLENVLVNNRGSQQRQRHPIRQAREYMLGLMDVCQRHQELQNLIHRDGAYRGRFTFPFGYFSILSNVTRQQLDESGKSVVFPQEKVKTRDELLEWENAGPAESLSRLRSYFDPWWPISPLGPEQTNALRAIIHPEIMLLPFMDESSALKETRSLVVLDSRQERHARSLGNGHRILYGVPGSGKTVILVARAKLLAQANPDGRYLFLCFNVALSLYIQRLLSSLPNVSVRYFDAWSKDLGICRKDDEENEALGERLLSLLQRSEGDARRYRAVFVDEAQDFARSWFQCALEAMEDPLDGDLIIVGDGNQGLYRNRPFTWAEAGIQAVGRTVHAKFDLDRCYRSTREVMVLAQLFASAGSAKPEEAVASLEVGPEQCVRSSGFRPVILQCHDPQEECHYAAALTNELLSGKWFGRDLPRPLLPSEIGILYRKASGEQNRQLLGQMEREIGPALWLSKDRASLQRMAEPLVKIQTIHSAKGLQFRAVILLWAGQMPSAGQADDPVTERRLMFVALTRAEEYLSVLFSQPSSFVGELTGSRAADLVEAPEQ
jgi:hypothetical protein